MTAPLDVVWIAPEGTRTSDPTITVVRRPEELPGVLAASAADRVLVHGGPSAPTATMRDVHAAGNGVVVERPDAGLALDAASPPPEMWFALRMGRGASAPGDSWRTALDRHPGLSGSPADAYAAIVTLCDGGPAPVAVTVDPPPPSDAEVLGRAAMTLAQAVPQTTPTTGLTAFREVSVVAYTRRRLLRRFPSAGARLPGVDDAARRDAAFWNGVRKAATDPERRSLSGAVAILMYHGFGNGEAASRYVLPATRLRRQLRLLRLLRRRVIDLDDYVDARERHEPIDPRSVVLTIDDGYRDTYDVAAPILARHGATATLFVPSGRIGAANDWSDEPALAGRPIADVALLRESGPIRIGSHAHTHPALTEIDVDDAREELRRSRRELTELLGRSVRTFAYPYGDEDDAVRSLVREAGFSAAVSSRGGKNLPAERLDTLRRIEIRGTDPLWRFALAVLVGSARPVATFRDGLEQ